MFSHRIFPDFFRTSDLAIPLPSPFGGHLLPGRRGRFAPCAAAREGSGQSSVKAIENETKESSRPFDRELLLYSRWLWEAYIFFFHLPMAKTMMVSTMPMAQENMRLPKSASGLPWGKASLRVSQARP